MIEGSITCLHIICESLGLTRFFHNKNLVYVGNILLADVIDSDSWRLWPNGDKRLMKDKQVYRNLVEVSESDLLHVKDNFRWVAQQLDTLPSPTDSLVVIVMGSKKDEQHGRKIEKLCNEYGIICELRISSAHKSSADLLKLNAQYEGSGKRVVFVAVAGRSNGLGPTLAGNTTFPVINCPPPSQDIDKCIWSSLEVPSGIGCTTVIYPECAALASANILSLHDYRIWAKLKVLQLNNYILLRNADASVLNAD